MSILKTKVGLFCLLMLVGIGLVLPRTALADAPPVNTWHKIPDSAPHLLWRVFAIDGGFMAVGDNGTIVKSSDGLNWDDQTALMSGRITAITRGNPGYVAVGDNGILFSADGATWSFQPYPEKLAGVVWAEGKYVAVGDQSTVLTSPDGINWTKKTGIESGNHYYSIIWADNKFVAVGGVGAAGGGGLDKIIVSTDGETWNTISGNVNGYLRGIEWGNNQFVAVGVGGKIRTSPDGVSWTDQTSNFSKDLWDAVWGNNQYTVVGRDGAILTSLDGVSWTVQEPLGTDTLYGITSMNNKYVAVGKDGVIFHGSYTVNDFSVDLTEDAITSRTIDFKWSKPTDAQTVEMEMKLASEGNDKWRAPTTIPAAIDVDTTSAVVTGLDPGTEYDFRLHIKGAWFDDYSNTVTVKTLNEYTLTYTAGPNGTVTGTSPQTVEHGKDGTSVSATPSAGYHFVRWSDGNTDNPRTDTNVTGNVSVTAEFAINEYTLTYTAGPNGSVTGTSPQTVEHGKDGTSVSAIPSAGYHFVQWSDGNTDNPRTDTNVTGNVSVTAEFAINQYTVTFDVYGGTPAIAPVLVNYNDTVSAPSPAPTKPGHAFDGWYEDPSELLPPFNFATPIQSDVTLYAKWNTNAYTVTFDVYGGSPVPDQIVVYLGKVTEPSPPPTKPGHTFGGWYTDMSYSTPFDFANSVITGNTTVYGKWTTNSYTVTFDVDGGTYVNNQYIAYLDPVSEPIAPTKPGHTFAGWFTDSTFSTPYDFSASAVTQDTVIYAKWTINQYTVSFETNGGSSIPDVQVDYDTAISAPASPVRSGYTFVGWFEDASLTDAWIFGQDTVKGNMTLYAKWKANSSSNNQSSAVVPESNPDKDLGFEIIINGSHEDQWARAVMIEQDGQPSVGIYFDEDSFLDRLNREGDSFTVTIPATDVEEDITSFLDGAIVKLMEEKRAVLEIRTKTAIYTMPAEQINIDAVSEAFGGDVNLHDIVIGIEIASPSAAMMHIAENAAAEGGFAIVAPPLEFRVKAAYGGAIHEIHSYTAYVERLIAIPENADPQRITTAVVVEPDGSLRHVPTKVVVINGVYYAQVNSLTDSTYATIWNPVEFADVAQHWARDAVNNMGSRMVVFGKGGGKFNPDDDITRAEFAAIVVRSLGLKLEKGESGFADVGSAEWYYDVVLAAYKYGLIDGFEDGTFRPDDKITREQAMVIIANAMRITGLQVQLQDRSAAGTVQAFQDAGNISSWASDGVARTIQAGIVSGRSSTDLAPQAFITRAEVAAIVERLLQKSGLI